MEKIETCEEKILKHSYKIMSADIFTKNDKYNGYFSKNKRFMTAAKGNRKIFFNIEITLGPPLLPKVGSIPPKH